MNTATASSLPNLEIDKLTRRVVSAARDLRDQPCESTAVALRKALAALDAALLV